MSRRDFERWRRTIATTTRAPAAAERRRRRKRGFSAARARPIADAGLPPASRVWSVYTARDAEEAVAMLTRRQVLQRGAIGSAGLARPAALRCRGRARERGRHAEAEEVGRALAGAAGARRPRRGQELHDRGEGVDDLAVPPGSAGDEDLGLLVRRPEAGLPYLGPTIVATRRPDDTVETSVTVEWRNELETAFLPNDPTLMGAVMPGEPVPIVHAPARRREPSAVRRHAAAVVHQGRREGPALHHQHVHVLQRAAREHGLVPRPRAGQHAHERLRGARRGSTSSATTRTRASPTTRSACPPARTRSRSCCRTRRSTPTGACSTRRRA